MVEVKFVNCSGDEVVLYQPDGSILRRLEGKCWDRDPKSGTLRTSIISQHETPPPPQPDPRWIDKVVWVYDCPDDSIYAPFKQITFHDGNRVKLKKRLFSKLPELDWPVVEFLFSSPKMKLIKERLDGEHSVLASIFQNGIPVRKTVNPLSKYAQYKRWFFIEQPVKTSNRQMDNTEIIQLGEGLRSSTELKRIEKLKKEEEERKLV